MSKRYWKFLVEDILGSIEKIEEYVGSKDFDKFKENNLIIDGVVRNLQIIGEASKNIPEKIKKKYNGIKWRHIVGLRNRIVHEYFGVDLKIIWVIIKQEIPDFEEQIKTILKEEKKKNS